MNNKLKKIIFGGSGLIGSNFTDGIKLSRKDVDLLDYNETYDCIKFYKPDIIIHSACKKLSSKLLYDHSADYFDENVQISLNIFRAAAKLNVKKLLVIGSINAFINKNDLLISDVYNHNIKKILCKEYLKQYNLNSNMIYLSNVYGPKYKDSRNGFISLVIKKCYDAIKNNTDLFLVGNKLHERNFIYVKDVIKVIESNYENTNDIIITTENTYQLDFIAKTVAEIMNFKGKIKWEGDYDNITNKKINYADEQLINVNHTSIYKGLQETINWFMENNIDAK